ncbi:MAG: bifunctional D-glycero-beta-D-manno-heptose-7-phosphate kinase/D-glycero-beta-D-manno-heptose 1-phosphate adenylyltransferase HldE [Syntrophobacter sp.]
MIGNIVDNFEKAKVLVLGDIMLDRYTWGTVGRISPEAPVPVVRVTERSEVAGGAGNVAVNLASLGCGVTLCGIVGTDHPAGQLELIFQNAGVDYHPVVDPSRPTITKTRIMAKNQQLLRIDEETVSLPSRAGAEEILSLLDAALAGYDVLILSDYGKGVLLDPELTRQAIALGRKFKVPVLVDPKGKDWSRYTGATCVKPNTDELKAVSGPISDENELIAEARKTLEARDLDWLLVTRGKSGMCLVGRDHPPLMVPARAREVYDVSGAGDTVIASLAAALAVGADMPEATRIANVCAGIVVGKLGTQPVTRNELRIALQTSGDGDPSFNKIAIPAVAEVMAKNWRSSGLRVVFANGCFDLLHPGHVHLLHQARALGDRLIVGLNTDSSVRRLKGPTRPILRENDRATLLAALSCVDAVVLFDEDTPLALIERLRPDILVKGSDYTIDRVVGKDRVESWGGRVELVTVLAGHSTTGISNRIASGNHDDEAPDLHS